ncbi:hypothetical protein THF1C08_10243 [Vibrio jasicida]|uniref:Transposase n=1 Tax=Vibrio jasicida TaxID=766224 RepID=A0AAU9QF81_9VIBR|nr:hypothetical protein THF1C08_10243 [Vibrio jasicida]CAH1564154.1 hypothetical protein THF1A12_10243 [Vibrio jasicida]
MTWFKFDLAEDLFAVDDHELKHRHFPERRRMITESHFILML